MSYVLGNKSLGQLVGIHPSLIACVFKAIQTTDSDFSVFDGLRNDRQQAHMVSIGASKTYNSYHLYGLAVDLVPFFHGRNWWDSKDKETQQRIDKAFSDISHAMFHAARELRVKVDNGYDLWGFDKPHFQLTGIRSQYDIRTLPHDLR